MKRENRKSGYDGSLETVRKEKERKGEGKETDRRKKVREADIADTVYSSWQKSKHFIYSPLQRDDVLHMPGALSLRPPAQHFCLLTDFFACKTPEEDSAQITMTRKYVPGCLMQHMMERKDLYLGIKGLKRNKRRWWHLI